MPSPLLSPGEKNQVAHRYQDGESMPQLAEAFGVAVGVIHRALKKQGVQRRTAREARALVVDLLTECRQCGLPCDRNAVKPLCPSCARRFCQRCDGRLPETWGSRLCPACKWAERYKKREPRLCRVCGRMGARRSKRDLCNVHIKWFCSLCEVQMPPGRVNHRCTKCDQERRLVFYAKPGRRCAQCGEGEARMHSSRCARCLHEEYEVQRWALMHLERPCVKCGVILAKGRLVPRCPKCQRHAMRERNRKRAALGAHRCAMCKEPLALSHDTYCNGCATMLANWREAWHQGDKVARMLGTVRPCKRWQEAAEPAAKYRQESSQPPSKNGERD